jgi:hypothetical protein
MERNAVSEQIFEVGDQAIAQPAVRVQERAAYPPLFAGIIYGETVFWIMLVSMVIAVGGLILYLTTGGYFNSTVLLNHLWQGSDSLTIWNEVGHVSHPLPWYSCFGMLGNGDMIAVLGLVGTGVAGIFGVWGVFYGLLRSRGGIYVAFAFIIGTILTLSALGILRLH